MRIRTPVAAACCAVAAVAAGLGSGSLTAVTAGVSLATLANGIVALPAQAHHSFAVFFDSDKSVTIQGTVKAFRFTNPHGMVILEVRDSAGKVSEWRAETNAPTVLTRRGWNRDSIKPGQSLTIEGWPSRDGKPFIRLRKATDAKGNLVGTAAFEHGEQS